jgi:PAS domain-containing protein
MLAICTYSLDRCRASEVIDVVSNHEFALIKREDKWETIESARRKRAEEALRESEEKYRNLFDGVPVGLCRTTPDGQILDINPALLAMLGFPDRETALAATSADGYVNPEDRARWQALMDREGVVLDYETQLRMAAGSPWS